MQKNMAQQLHRLSPGISRKIWGGSRLSRLKNIADKAGDLPIGETWEISIHLDAPSSAPAGLLSDIFTHEQMPYLVKLIDTSDNLSVQVHPGDAYAKEHENSVGKTECWLILDSAPGCGIYLGLKEGVTKERLQKAVTEGEEVHELLNFYETKAGDFFYVPHGSIHAIGKDVFLAEVQQSSGITYRVWDWNRVDEQGKSRELHINKAMDVINFDPDANCSDNFQFQKSLFQIDSEIELVDHEDFNFKLIPLKKDQTISLEKSQKIISFLNLKGKQSYKLADQKITLSEYEAGVANDTTSITALEDSLIIYVS